MKIPYILKHKPVVVSENYEQIDGRFARNTDAKVLSVGLAQWNDRGKVDISAKVWRYTGENISIYMIRKSLSSTGLACKGMR